MVPEKLLHQRKGKKPMRIRRLLVEGGDGAGKGTCSVDELSSTVGGVHKELGGLLTL